MEALTDGFQHIIDITDPETVRWYRDLGVRIDDEGYYSFSFGEHKEYEMRIEPLGTEDQYYVSLYKNGVLLTERLPVWTRKSDE